MPGIYTDTRFDDLDLDTRSRRVSRGNSSALNYLDVKGSNQHYICHNGKLFIFFLHDLECDFENMYMIGPAC